MMLAVTFCSGLISSASPTESTIGAEKTAAPGTLRKPMREGMRKATQRESRARLLIPLIRPSIAPEAFITLPIMVIRAIEMSRVRPLESMIVSCNARASMFIPLPLMAATTSAATAAASPT